MVIKADGDIGTGDKPIKIDSDVAAIDATTMPLVRGGSVAGLVKEYGALPVRWVSQLLDQTLQALEAVHAAGIVHRDVKPANLLLEPTGTGRPHLRLLNLRSCLFP